MNLSFFPKGYYTAKKTVISFKKSVGTTSNEGVFAVSIGDTGDAGDTPIDKTTNSKYAKIWDITSFRPDPRLESWIDVNSDTSGGVPATVLFETVNCRYNQKLYK